MRVKLYDKEKFDYRKKHYIMVEDRKLFLAIRKEFDKWPNVCQYDEYDYEVYFYKPYPSIKAHIKLLMQREEMTGSYFIEGGVADETNQYY